MKASEARYNTDINAVTREDIDGNIKHASDNGSAFCLIHGKEVSSIIIAGLMSDGFKTSYVKDFNGIDHLKIEW